MLEAEWMLPRPAVTRSGATPDGVRLAVQEWGDPAGPELLLIHGVAQSHLCFVRQVTDPGLRRCRIVSYDVRGHGGSAKPADPAAYQQLRLWADEVQAVIEATGLRRPVLVGWSLGGRMIGQYLIVHGDARLAGINFVAARAIANPAFSGPAMRNLPELQPDDLGSQIAFAAGFLRACFERQPSAADFALALAYNMRTPVAVRDAIRTWAAGTPETEAALRRVTVPVLVTHGRLDGVVLPAAAERTASLIPHAALFWYDECGHSPFAEDARRFNRELLAFVEG